MKEITITDINKNELWVHDIGNVIFLEGSEFIGGTEKDVYEFLARYGVNCCVISNLYQNPEQILALKYLNFSTIILGTTGVRWEKLDKLKEIFISVGKLPKIIMFTMGEECFNDIITSEMRIFKIHSSGLGIIIPIIEILNN